MYCWPVAGAERFAREIGAEAWGEMLTEPTSRTRGWKRLSGGRGYPAGSPANPN